jgi:hypothetical protein
MNLFVAFDRTWNIASLQRPISGTYCVATGSVFDRIKGRNYFLVFAKVDGKPTQEQMEKRRHMYIEPKYRTYQE